MDSKPLDQIELSPFVELFGTFFEKLTNKHPQKDPLRKELAEFKCTLYTSQKDAGQIDAYLNSLSNKSIIPLQNPNNRLAVTATAGTGKTASNSNTNNEGSPKNKPSFNFIKKVEILLISDFLKYRSVGRADKKQTLLSRYSHVQSLEKNPNNFYKTLAIYIFTLIMKSPGSDKVLSDIVDEVAAKRIELACPAENLTHDDICGIFCGYFSQLIRMGRMHQPTIKVLETFHDMIGSEKVFGAGLACFVKSKIYSFVDQAQFPYEFISLKMQVQSKAFKEKVENNDNSQLDNVLRLIPFIFQKDVLLHVFENGTLSDVAYKAPKANSREGQIITNDSEGMSTIYLLIEKVFLTVTVFGLFTIASSPFVFRPKSPGKTIVSVNAVSSNNTRPSLTGTSPYVPKKIESKIPRLALDSLLANSQNPVNQEGYLCISGNSLSNRDPMPETEYKYAPSSYRYSYTSSGIGLMRMNSERTSSQPGNYQRSYTSIERDSYAGVKKNLGQEFKKQELRSDSASINLQVVSTRNSNLSINLTNAVSNPVNSSLTERTYKADSNYSSYYPRNNNHIKTVSYSYNNLGTDRATTSVGDSARNSVSLQQYQSIKPSNASMGQSQYKYMGRNESISYPEQNSRTYSSYLSSRQDKSYQGITQKSVLKPNETTELNSKANPQESESNNSPVFPNNSLTAEKLKNIVAGPPKVVVQLSSFKTSLSESNTSTYTTQNKPYYQYTSKYAASISNSSKYQTPNSITNLDNGNQIKPESKYQISASYSYKRRTSGALTDRTEYTQQTEASQNSSLANDTLTYRPYAPHNPSSFRNDRFSSITKNNNRETSQGQLTTLSTNTSICNNMLPNQMSQQQTQVS